MLRSVSQSSTEFYCLDVIQTGWNLDVIQLMRAASQSSARLIRSDRVSFTSMALEAAFDQTLSTKLGCISFGLPSINSTPVWVDNELLPSQALVLFDPRKEHKSSSRPGFNATSIHLKVEHVIEIVEKVFHREISDVLMHAGCNLLTAPAHEEICMTLLRWEEFSRLHCQLPESEVGKLEDELVQLILSSLFNSKSIEKHRSRKRDRALDFALQVIHDEYSRELTVSELCQVAECSISTLETSFMHRFGVTPKRYIKGLQLSKVRRDLRHFEKDKNRSITDIATRYGIWHMGQFAADYKRHFGELPSETLSRYRT